MYSSENGAVIEERTIIGHWLFVGYRDIYKHYLKTNEIGDYYTHEESMYETDKDSDHAYQLYYSNSLLD